MVNEVLQKVGTQLSFADHAGDFNPTAVNDLQQGTPTDVQIALASLADGSARQSAKADFGATRARAYSVMAAIETGVATSGDVIEFYWAPSPDPTAANGNPGYVSGSDSAYDGGVAELAEGLEQLQFIGSMVCSADAAVQIALIGILLPSDRYGTLVIVNQSGASLHTDDVESHVVFTPIVDEIQ